MGENNNLKILGFLVAAVVLRYVLKLFPLPSVEPIIALAVLAGLTLGMEAGLVVGAGGFFLSNFFVPGGQGFWTFWQAIGAGIAGVLPAAMGKTYKLEEVSSEKYLGYTVLGVVVFEALVSLPSGQLFFMPFSLIHVVSSALIAYVIYLLYKK